MNFPFRTWYESANYKSLMVIPLIIFLLSVGILLYHYQSTGEWFRKGIDMEGGVQLSLKLTSDFDDTALERFLSERFGKVKVRKVVSATGYGALIQCGYVDQDELLNAVKEYGLDVEESTFQEVGSALGKSFWKQSQSAMILAFILMGGIVFIIFRKVVPSLGVIFAAVGDILGALAFMQVLGIDLTLASFAALLLTLGYSIDTDILLTTRLLKRREGSVVERSIGAMKTGLMMTLTTMAALGVLYVISTAPALREISSVLLIALAIDIPNTWLMNVGLLRWYLERK